MSVHVLLVDDHPLFRSGMKSTLEESAYIDHVSEASSLQEARNILSEENIDLIYLDINLPDGNGIDYLKNSTDSSINVRFIMLSMYNDAELVREAVSAGASGYMCKDATHDEILSSAERVLQGKTFYNSTIIDALARPVPTNPVISQIETLTPSEQRILKLVSQSYSSKEIGKKLSVNYRTVENHRTKISQKLDLSRSDSLIKFALKHKELIDKTLA